MYQHPTLIKLLLIGNPGVGKSSLLTRFAENEFDEQYIYTIGVDFKVRTMDIDGRRVKLQIWDTAGQERFRTFTNSYFRGAHGVSIIYDVTDWRSFEAVKNWLKDVERFSSEKLLAKILVGNKCDKIGCRVVQARTAQLLAEENDMILVETSAKNGQNVETAFRLVASQILTNMTKKAPLHCCDRSIYASKINLTPSEDRLLNCKCCY